MPARAGRVEHDVGRRRAARRARDRRRRARRPACPRSTRAARRCRASASPPGGTTRTTSAPRSPSTRAAPAPTARRRGRRTRSPSSSRCHRVPPGVATFPDAGVSLLWILNVVRHRTSAGKSRSMPDGELPDRRRRLPHPRAARHLDELAAGEVAGQGAEAREGPRGRRRVAHRGRRRPRPDRARRRRRACRSTSSAGTASPTKRRAPVATTATSALEDMDIDGVDAEILFPPQRTMSHFLGDDDDDFVLAGVEAYNNFLFEEFCAPDPKRLDRHGADPVARHRQRGRRAAQGQGARREGRAHLELAGGRARASRATTTRSGPRRSTRACRSRSTSTSSAGRSAARRRKAAAAKRQPALRHGERGDARQGDRRHEPRVRDGDRRHDRHDLHRRVRALPRAAGLLDRDRRRLDPALPRVHRRPLVAQPRVGRPAAHASRRRSTGTATTRRRSSSTAPASSCATGSASTT